MGVLFLTGFPGFIASRLLSSLADNFDTIHLLVEERMLERAKGFIEGLGVGAEVHTGDIRYERLGLSPSLYNRLKEEVTHIMHLAAIYNLRVDWDPAYEVNVVGTERVTQFAKETVRLERYVYFSTLYVAGWRRGIIFEDEFIGEYGFKNHYEHTKFLAEKIVREYLEELPITIIRPAIVVGDSKTGETSKFDGPYFVMRFFKKIPGRFPLPYIGKGNAEVNLVPVDYIVDATVALMKMKESLHKTFHLADPNPLRARELYKMFHEKIRGCLPKGTVPLKLVESALKWEGFARWLGVPREALPYFYHDVHFDTYNSRKFLEPLNVKVPHITSYADSLVDYFLEHYKDPDKYVF